MSSELQNDVVDGLAISVGAVALSWIVMKGVGKRFFAKEGFWYESLSLIGIVTASNAGLGALRRADYIRKQFIKPSS